MSQNIWQKLNDFKSKLNPYTLSPIWRNAIKAGIACAIGMLLSRLFFHENKQWILITIIVVMSAQINLGTTLQKALMRCLGTFGGVAISILTILLFKTNQMAHDIVIIISIVIFSYFAGKQNIYSYVGTLGAATVAIILFHDNVSIEYGLERMFEITLGILIAVCVSLLVFPHKAYSLFEKQILTTLARLNEFYHLLFQSSKEVDTSEETNKIENILIKNLAEYRRLANEFKFEPGKKRLSSTNIQNIDQALRHLMRAIASMHSASNQLLAKEILLNGDPVVKDFNHAVIRAFQNIAHAFANGEKKEDLSLEENLHSLEEKIKSLAGAHPFEEQRIYSLFLNGAKDVVYSLKKISQI